MLLNNKYYLCIYICIILLKSWSWSRRPNYPVPTSLPNPHPGPLSQFAISHRAKAHRHYCDHSNTKVKLWILFFFQIFFSLETISLTISLTNTRTKTKLFAKSWWKGCQFSWIFSLFFTFFSEKNFLIFFTFNASREAMKERGQLRLPLQLTKFVRGHLSWHRPRPRRSRNWALA